MKRIKLFAEVLNIIMIILIVIMMLEFLATTDIYHDYASKNVVARFAPAYVNDFPLWTETPSEWKMFNFSYVSRIILIITSLILSLSISYIIKEKWPDV